MSDQRQNAEQAFIELYDRVFYWAAAAFIADGMNSHLAYTMAHHEASRQSQPLYERMMKQSDQGE